MQFQKYKKTSLTVARVLTPLDEQVFEGVINTLEGPKSFVAGDYLAHDAKGQWPIKREKIERDYRQVVGPNAWGFAQYQPLDVREACQMQEAFTIGTLTGKPGDYVVKGKDSSWPVDRELFEQSYTRIEEEKQA